MRDAETILGIIRERGRRDLPLEDVYRQLFNPALYLRAYGKIYRNDGAMTPGVTAETVDGMSLEKIQGIIEALRFERYCWTPVRRTYIEKKGSTKKRPLGLPTWSDKLLQEAIRSLLEAYYEPQFSPASHGFRPGLGCHTALTEIGRVWTGTAWFIEGDIKGCFDNIDQTVLLSILRERIHDNRFLRLVGNLLKAGYVEDWKYDTTHSGTPQGGIVSPILANIYLDRLDKFVESALLPTYNRGTVRKANPVYRGLMQRARRLERLGRHAEGDELHRKARQIPSSLPDDPGYRRLRYVRYADDFLLGFAGPRGEAEVIKRSLGEFLRDSLKLELSEGKTLITHAWSGAARFLGYKIRILRDRRRGGRRGRRRLNGVVTLKVPVEDVRAKCRAYMRRGKPIHRVELVAESEFSIVEKFQQEYRGFAEYYKLATDRSICLRRLRWVMESALTKTLASKLRISVREVYRRFGATLKTGQGPRKGLEVRVEREGRPPLVARWGGISLARQRWAILDDRIQPRAVSHVELLTRLLADACELCGSREEVQVHHIRHLRDIRRRWRGRGEPPRWVKTMASRRRKTLVVCRACHVAIHGGKLRGQGHRIGDTGEPDAVKVARPVRRGADGKGPT